MEKGDGHSPILTFTHAPQRVVSLVPSMTESLFDLGQGARVVGVTDYCHPPAEEAARVTRVGGTRSPNLETILRLAPDLVMANQEENSREAVEAMEAKGLKVWVTFPRSVGGAIEVLWALIELFRADPRSVLIVRTLETTLEWTAKAAMGRSPTRVFCPIWQGETAAQGLWWMTFNQGTYAHDLLACCGGHNVFSLRDRRYPLEADLGAAPPEVPGDRDTRYPRVLPEEVRQAMPEAILLPSEPFAFDARSADRISELLADTPAVRNGRVHLVDGSLITWHGTRMARALSEIPRFLFIEA
jgi:ABC-type Fe3+-hydroxamate transport system substrate-binding protein